MKLLIALLGVLLILIVPAVADTPDLSGLSMQELMELIGQAQKALEMQEEVLIPRALEALKSDWKERYATDLLYDGTGYIEILHTQVIYIRGEFDVDAQCQSRAAEYFGGVDCIVEFVIMDDYLGTAPYYTISHGVYSVLFYEDGSQDVMRGSQFNYYRTRTFSTDYNGIIESISDRNNEFNQTWHLLQ